MTPASRASRSTAIVVLAACVLLAAACGRAPGVASTGGKASSQDISPTANLVVTTPAGTKPVQQVTWAVYRDVNSLDPAFAFDYPENTAISLMCESLLRQSPDGSISSGLASVANPDPDTFVFTVNPAARFWDGNPVTGADVAYSLRRQMDSGLGGFYTATFDRVKVIQQTGPDQVTVTMKQPDYWLAGELSGMAGVVVEKSAVIKQGKNYGTPAGSIMCTGQYQLKSWSPSSGVVAVVSPHYWNSAAKAPLTQQITLKGVPDTNDLTAGLETGAIQGTYPSGGLPTLGQLRQNSAVTVYQGAGWSTDAMIISSATGPLANVRVRQALSLAVNRQSIIDNVYKGAALMPKWLANPGVFGYGRQVFDAAYNKAPSLTQNVAEAKKLVREAGAAGQTITIGSSSELSATAFETGVYQQAAEEIGLSVKLKNVSAQDYINFFTDPSSRKGVDMFSTINYGDYAAPESLLATIVMSDGSQNYDAYRDPRMTALMNQERSTADPDARAALMARAEELAAQTLPWIPTVQPTSVLIMSSGLSGAVASFSYMFAPWATELGGK